MDEPLSNLDAKLRVQMRSEIGTLQKDLGVTTIYVTHDQVEALAMGDRVAVMRKGGELQQVAPPQELYDRPVSLFVAGFIGSPTMNMMEATVEEAGDGLSVAIGDQKLAVSPEALDAHPRLREYVGRRVVLGIRPEDLEDAALVQDTPEERRLRGAVLLTEALGSEINVHVEIDAPPVLTEDTRELAEDVGTAHHYETHERQRSEKSKIVGRLNPRTRAKIGESIELSSTRGRSTSSTSTPASVSTTASRSGVRRQRARARAARRSNQPRTSGARSPPETETRSNKR
jgi:multiple sugar transport system ATP-binding protein